MLITKEKQLLLYVEDCARVLGVTQTKIKKDGTYSTTVRWERVYEDLVAIDKISNRGDFKNLKKEQKKEMRNQLKISMTTWYNNYKKMSNQNK